jgi:phage baseplate assembly protein gpV
VSTIINTLQEIVRHELRAIRVAELGLVEAVFPHSVEDDNDNYGCDVRLKNSGLLLKRVPLTTGHIGTAAVPNVGDLVLLAFDKGDVNQPIIIGRLYNDEDRPPLNDSDEVIFRLPLADEDDKTIKAAIRSHEDDDPPRTITVEMPPKITVQISDGQIRATAGETELLLDQPDDSGGQVVIKAGRTRITMNQDGDITVESEADITVTAAGDMALRGRNISIEGDLDVSIEAGKNAELKGQLGATLDGGLSATVQGVNLSLKGITSFSV